MLNHEVSEIVAVRVKEVRNKRGMKARDLATRCAELGMPHLSAATLSNIETGRPKDGQRTRDVTVDELVVLALALNVAPVHLLVPIDDDNTGYPATNVRAGRTREWIRGYHPLSGTAEAPSERDYFSEVPEFEWTPPTNRPIPVDSAPERQARLAELERRGLGDLQAEE
ncbi:hypothetical protein GCM10027176_45870 [Actinoallomurus bryophytorum]|uniref:DNA-binding Xre family transcriptional regulator n=1 Tax=Actinoallomurus bryophytorum TaxID=1490222 RepID=A0A543CCD8_9ACTN|nr:helix-turn-helix transcriptional regulator [Actinoallomurus bryophytorum]TQL94762.1 DNA-binding Xre family transcriptional regulator [Actinoallomurus bryophytorum]